MTDQSASENPAPEFPAPSLPAPGLPAPEIPAADSAARDSAARDSPAPGIPAPEAYGGDTFRVAFNPVPTANRVAELGGRLRATIWRSLLVAALLTAFYVWKASSLGGWSVTLLVVAWVPTIALITWYAVKLAGARRNLAGIGTGDALVIGRAGIEGVTPGQSSERMPWGEIASVAAASGGLGREPDLVVTRHDGRRWSVPLAFLDAQVGTIDNAVRVFSGGRKGLDVTNLSL